MRRDSDCAMSRPVPLVALALLCCSSLLRSAEAVEAASIHTIFSTECNRYFDWCVRTTAARCESARAFRQRRACSCHSTAQH